MTPTGKRSKSSQLPGPWPSDSWDSFSTLIVNGFRIPNPIAFQVSNHMENLL